MNTLALFLALTALSIQTQSPLAGGTQGVVYSQALTASGGMIPYRFSITSGTLPAGVNLNQDGSIAGTPTDPGTFNFTTQVADSTGETSSGSFAISIKPASAAPIIANVSPLPVGTINSTYSQTFTAEGGNRPYSWTTAQSALPPGLSMDASGNLSGTPTATGKFGFTIQVTDRVGVSTNKTFSLTVNPPQ